MRLSGRLLALIALGGLALRADPIDLKQLDRQVFDRLAEKANGKTEINLDGDMLRFGAGFLGDSDDKDAARIKKIISGLTNVTVRNYTFKKKGDYSADDVKMIHQQIQTMNWKRVVDSTDKDDEEHSEVYILPGKAKPEGLFVLVAEPLELTMVYILGTIDVNDLSALENLGVPDDITSKMGKGSR